MLEDIMIREFIPAYYYDDWLVSTVNYKKVLTVNKEKG